MQLIGDFAVGVLLVFAVCKLLVKFGWWSEKRGEKIIEEIKKEPKQNG